MNFFRYFQTKFTNCKTSTPKYISLTLPSFTQKMPFRARYPPPNQISQMANNGSARKGHCFAPSPNRPSAGRSAVLPPFLLPTYHQIMYFHCCYQSAAGEIFHYKSGAGVLLHSKKNPPPGGVLKFSRSCFPKHGPGF